MNVLSADNSAAGGDGGVLRTCALRLAGVYGPGEQRHLPRIVVRSAPSDFFRSIPMTLFVEYHRLLNSTVSMSACHCYGQQ